MRGIYDRYHNSAINIQPCAQTVQCTVHPYKVPNQVNSAFYSPKYGKMRISFWNE